MADEYAEPPGRRMLEAESRLIVDKFHKIYREGSLRGRKSSFPTSGVLSHYEEGTVGELFAAVPDSQKSVYLYFEYFGDGPPHIYETKIPNIHHYLMNKSPCDEPEMCVFDSSLDWGIFISHNWNKDESDFAYRAFAKLILGDR